MPNTRFSPEGVLQFKAALGEQAQSWESNPPEYNAAPGSEKAYDKMGNELLSRVRESAGVGEEFKRPSVTSGMAVIPRFIYAGATKAALAGFSVDQLRQSMYNHGSFNTLSAITHERLPVAKRAEVSLGLKPLPGVSVDDHLDDFEISEETGLSIPRYGTDVLLDARFDAYYQGHINGEQLAATNPSFCEGQLTGINSHAYRAMLTICINDPHLFQATLDR